MTERDYSPISWCAAISASTGVASILGFLVPEATWLAVPAAAFGMAAIWAIRKYGLSGRHLAKVGLVCSIPVAMLAPAWHLMRFQGEAAPGYERVSFTYSKDANLHILNGLVGSKVCLKGYAIPMKQAHGLQEFYFSPDGARPLKEHDIVWVELSPGTAWDYEWEGIAVSGILERISDGSPRANVTKYVLRQSEVRHAVTRFGLLPHAPRNGC